MENIKHTPGPWSIVENRANEDGSTATGICGGPDHYLADVYCRYVGSENLPKAEAAANASLIAAAPELLEELAKAVSEAEQSEFERWLFSESPSGDSEAVQSQWEQSANFQDFHNWWGGAIAAIAKARGES